MAGKGLCSSSRTGELGKKTKERPMKQTPFEESGYFIRDPSFYPTQAGAMGPAEQRRPVPDTEVRCLSLPVAPQGSRASKQ